MKSWESHEDDFVGNASVAASYMVDVITHFFQCCFPFLTSGYISSSNLLLVSIQYCLLIF